MNKLWSLVILLIVPLAPGCDSAGGGGEEKEWTTEELCFRDGVYCGEAISSNTQAQIYCGDCSGWSKPLTCIDNECVGTWTCQDYDACVSECPFQDFTEFVNPTCIRECGSPDNVAKQIEDRWWGEVFGCYLDAVKSCGAWDTVLHEECTADLCAQYLMDDGTEGPLYDWCDDRCKVLTPIDQNACLQDELNTTCAEKYTECEDFSTDFLLGRR